MKSNVSNSVLGALDYLAYPSGMLLLAPVILSAMGTERYGIWALASAMLNTGAILASGFGDANIRTVAAALGKGNRSEILETVGSSLGIQIFLGLLFNAIGWFIAPEFAAKAATTSPILYRDCLWSLRLASVLIFLRAIETACVSTQRAYGRYGAAIQFSLIARVASIIAAAVIPSIVLSVVAVMMATVAITAASVALQINSANRLIGVKMLLPGLRSHTTRGLMRFGGYTWIQSAAALLFNQIDRIYVGLAFTAAAVTPYVFCVQLTQPIYGITAAGLHFLLPHIATASANGSLNQVRRSVGIAAAANVAFVVIAFLAIVCFGNQFLRFWGGPFVGSQGAPLLLPLACSTSLAALTVTGTYALLALGKPRAVMLLHLAGGASVLAALPLLCRTFGLLGVAYSRVFFGLAVLAVYIPLYYRMNLQGESVSRPPLAPISEET